MLPQQYSNGKSGTPTMSSVELVEVINTMRDEGKAELRHDNFMAKIAAHPAIDSPKYLGQYKDSTGRSLKCYHLPKRECELMVMSESPAVQAKVYDRMAMLEAGAVAVPRARLTVDPALSAFRRARAIEVSGKTASEICNRFPGLSADAQQVIFAKLVNQAAGDDIVPLPVLQDFSYSATDIGSQIGISATMVGRIANSNGLKVPKYGHIVLDKSASSDKQVETFRYNAAGVARITELARAAA